MWQVKPNFKEREISKGVLSCCGKFAVGVRFERCTSEDWLTACEEILENPEQSILKELHFTHCNLTNQLVESIGRMTNLSKLTLADCNIEVLKPLQTLTKLEYLDLSGNGLDVREFEWVIKYLPSLHYLNFPIKAEELSLTGDGDKIQVGDRGVRLLC